MAEVSHTVAWRGSTDGTPRMQRMLIRLFKLCPLAVVYAVMGLVIPFYMLFANGFRASYLFYRKRMGYGPFRSFLGVYLNEFNLGMVVLDRFAAYSGKTFRFEIEGEARFRELLRQPEGFMMIGSHFGNHEMAGYFIKSEGKRINALVYAGETQTVMEGRSGRFGATNVRMIPLSEDMSHIFAMNAALADGEILSVAGDRCFGSEKIIRCPFFGQEASFPMGLFRREVPMVALFVTKESVNGYKVWVDPLPPAIGDTREERMRSLCAAYATLLEKRVRQYPHQWYNFYDFWA